MTEQEEQEYQSDKREQLHKILLQFDKVMRNPDADELDRVAEQFQNWRLSHGSRCWRVMGIFADASAQLRREPRPTPAQLAGVLQELTQAVQKVFVSLPGDSSRGRGKPRTAVVTSFKATDEKVRDSEGRITVVSKDFPLGDVLDAIFDKHPEAEQSTPTTNTANITNNTKP